MLQLWIIARPNGAGKTTIIDWWFARRIPVISQITLQLSSFKVLFNLVELLSGNKNSCLAEEQGQPPSY